MSYWGKLLWLYILYKFNLGGAIKEEKWPSSHKLALCFRMITFFQKKKKKKTNCTILPDLHILPCLSQRSTRLENYRSGAVKNVTERHKSGQKVEDHLSSTSHKFASHCNGISPEQEALSRERGPCSYYRFQMSD